MAVILLSALCILLAGGCGFAIYWLIVLHKRDDDFDEYHSFLLEEINAQGILKEYQGARKIAIERQKDQHYNARRVVQLAK